VGRRAAKAALAVESARLEAAGLGSRSALKPLLARAFAALLLSGAQKKASS
jgi:hypothetical protein